MKILLFNAGSSSLKCALMNSRDGSVVAQGAADWAGKTTKYHLTVGNGEKVVFQIHKESITATLMQFVYLSSRSNPRAYSMVEPE